MNTPVEAVPMNTDANIAVMAVELRYIKETVERIEKHNVQYVTRMEWEQRNGYVDSRIATISNEVASRRVPWWVVASPIAAIVAVGITFMEIIGGRTP